MKVVILAAGYGTRLQRDLEQDTSSNYRHLLGVPKPLLPVGGVPLVTHWVRALESLLQANIQVRELIIAVNDSNVTQFQQWKCSLSTPLKVTLISNGAISNETRPGAITCMLLALDGDHSENVLFIGGDTLFPGEFSLADFVTSSLAEVSREPTSCHVTAVPCAEEAVSRHGIIEVDDTGRVVGFREKPQPTETTSRLQCPCFYLLPSASLQLLEKYLEEHCSLQERDATGLFVAYLVHRTRVMAHHAPGRYDVGNLQTYLACCEDLEREKIAS